MNQRLIQFLSAQNLSQSQFADTLGVAKASVSHIIAGRNKPGCDFLESMIKHYPALNLEWLLTGKGKMFKTTQAPSSLFDEMPYNSQDEEQIPESRSTSTIQVAKANTIDNQKFITKILVFYSDNTFTEIK